MTSMKIYERLYRAKSRKQLPLKQGTRIILARAKLRKENQFMSQTSPAARKRVADELRTKRKSIGGKLHRQYYKTGFDHLTKRMGGKANG